MAAPALNSSAVVCVPTKLVCKYSAQGLCADLAGWRVPASIGYKALYASTQNDSHPQHTRAPIISTQLEFTLPALPMWGVRPDAATVAAARQPRPLLLDPCLCLALTTGPASGPRRLRFWPVFGVAVARLGAVRVQLMQSRSTRARGWLLAKLRGQNWALWGPGRCPVSLAAAAQSLPKHLQTSLVSAVSQGTSVPSSPCAQWFVFANPAAFEEGTPRRAISEVAVHRQVKRAWCISG